MKATVRKLGRVAVVDIVGKITIGEGDVLLREKVLELLEAGENRILLNLEKSIEREERAIHDDVTGKQHTVFLDEDARVTARMRRTERHESNGHASQIDAVLPVEGDVAAAKLDSLQQLPHDR